MIGVTKYVELVAIRQRGSITIGNGNVREIYEPVLGMTVRDVVFKAGLNPADFDLWTPDYEFMNLKEINLLDQVTNGDVIVLTHITFDMDYERATAAYAALRSIMPSRYVVFREPDPGSGSDIPVRPSPHAVISSTERFGSVPLNATFDASGSYDEDGLITGYRWDFGDGSTSTDVVVAHQYQSIGTYVARLTVTNDIGMTNSTTLTITVAAPDAFVAHDQSLSMISGNTLSVTLTATDSKSRSLTYSIVRSPAHGVLTGTAPNVIYTPDASYVGADSFLFVANNGEVDSNSATINVNVQSTETPTIISGPTITPTTIYVSDLINFSIEATSVSPVALRYLWDFGDGSTYSTKIGTHTYMLPGTYVVTVTVSVGSSTTLKATASVTLVVNE